MAQRQLCVVIPIKNSAQRKLLFGICADHRLEYREVHVAIDDVGDTVIQTAKKNLPYHVPNHNRARLDHSDINSRILAFVRSYPKCTSKEINNHIEINMGTLNNFLRRLVVQLELRRDWVADAGHYLYQSF